MKFDKCEKCIIGAYDASRAPCQNCYDRYSKAEIKIAALEFLKEKHEENIKNNWYRFDGDTDILK